MLKKTLIIMLALGLSMPLMAQRTAYGERMLSATVSWTISSVGGEARFGQYLMNGFWFGELALNNRMEVDAPSQEKVHFPHAQLGGGYMFRLYGTRTRAINLYGGAGAFIGMEMLDLWKTLTVPTRRSFLENGFKEFRFIYGVSPQVEAEFFIFKDIALTINGKMPVTLNSKFDIINWEIGGGVKYNF